MEILRDLFNYIDFLRSRGLAVSVSGFKSTLEPYYYELLKYEIHPHSLCFYLKQNKATQGMCVANKRMLDNAKIKEPYYSCCYAGVEEYVVPVFYEDTCIMRVNISGYRGTLKKSDSFMRRLSKKCDDAFFDHYGELSTAVPSLEEVMRFVKPIEYIATKLYLHCQSTKESGQALSVTKQIYQEAINFIQDNYMCKLSCGTLAKHLSYSVSYLQYVFKKEGGVTLKAKINDVRLENAAFLLLNSKMNITEISFSCGFYDSNYFSSAFKNKYGLSPKRYRNKSAQ